MGKRQIWRSLKTKNYDIARAEARKLLLSVEQLFFQMRETMDSRLINGMVAEYGLRWIRDTDKARIGITVSGGAKYNEYMQERAKCMQPRTVTSSDGTKMGKVTSADIGKALADVANLYKEFEAEEGILSTPYATELADKALTHYNSLGLVETPDEVTEDNFKEVVAAFAVVERQLFKMESERIQGIREDESDFQHRLLEKWNKDKLVKKDVGIPLPDLFNEYGNQYTVPNQARIKRKVAELRRLEESFRECFNKVIGVKELDEDKAVEWRNSLQFEYHSDRGLVMANKTVNNYRKTVSAVINWAMGKRSPECSAKPLKKYVTSNPFSTGLALPNGIESEHSRIFDDKELQKYVEVLAENYNRDELEMTWLPLIMMYSGMRCNEVAQLFLDDVRESRFFRITENSDRNQRVKCKSSAREVPIHEKLIELGFLKYVARMHDAREVQLFPNCKYQNGTGYYYSDAMSSRLNAAINLNISADRKLRLYSLRANFRSAIITRCTNQNIDSILAGGAPIDGYIERALDEIMGHAISGGTGRTTYTKLDIRVKAHVMPLLEYPINLDHVKALLT
jgi:integrase